MANLNTFIQVGANTGNFIGSINGTTISGSGNVTGGNILSSGFISATGNILANAYIGNGSQLTGVATSSSVKQVLGLTMIYGGR